MMRVFIDRDYIPPFQINIFLCFAVFGLLVHEQRLYDAFGFFDTRPVYIGLIIIFQVPDVILLKRLFLSPFAESRLELQIALASLFQFIFAPYKELLSFLMTCISRKFEFEADEFAVGLGKGK